MFPRYLKVRMLRAFDIHLGLYRMLEFMQDISAVCQRWIVVCNISFFHNIDGFLSIFLEEEFNSKFLIVSSTVFMKKWPKTMGIQFGRTGWKVGKKRRVRRKRLQLRLKEKPKFHLSNRWKTNRKYLIKKPCMIFSCWKEKENTWKIKRSGR